MTQSPDEMDFKMHIVFKKDGDKEIKTDIEFTINRTGISMKENQEEKTEEVRSYVQRMLNALNKKEVYNKRNLFNHLSLFASNHGDNSNPKLTKEQLSNNKDSIDKVIDFMDKFPFTYYDDYRPQIRFQEMTGKLQELKERIDNIYSKAPLNKKIVLLEIVDLKNINDEEYHFNVKLMSGETLYNLKLKNDITLKKLYDEIKNGLNGIKFFNDDFDELIVSFSYNDTVAAPLYETDEEGNVTIKQKLQKILDGPLQPSQKTGGRKKIFKKRKTKNKTKTNRKLRQSKKNIYIFE